MSEKVIFKLNGAIILEQEKAQTELFDYCEDKAPRGEWKDVTLKDLNGAISEVKEDLRAHEKGKNRWEHILQISKFNPKETEEAYGYIEQYDEHIKEITHTLNVFENFVDIININTNAGIEFKMEWTITE